MENNMPKVMLGTPINTDVMNVIMETPTTMTVEERIKVLEEKLAIMTEAFNNAKNALADKDTSEKNAYVPENVNKDGIPFKSSFIGTSKGLPYVLTVSEIGTYYIGATPHPSLSAAAKAVSGVRRSGWTFWKLPDGRSIKEVFKLTR